MSSRIQCVLRMSLALGLSVGVLPTWGAMGGVQVRQDPLLSSHMVNTWKIWDALHAAQTDKDMDNILSSIEKQNYGLFNHGQELKKRLALLEQDTTKAIAEARSQIIGSLKMNWIGRRLALANIMRVAQNVLERWRSYDNPIRNYAAQEVAVLGVLSGSGILPIEDKMLYERREQVSQRLQQADLREPLMTLYKAIATKIIDLNGVIKSLQRDIGSPVELGKKRYLEID